MPQMMPGGKLRNKAKGRPNNWMTGLDGLGRNKLPQPTSTVDQIALGTGMQGGKSATSTYNPGTA